MCYFPTPRPINICQYRNSILLIIFSMFLYFVWFISQMVHLISFSFRWEPIITISFLRSISALHRNLETKGQMQKSFLKCIHNVLNIDWKLNKMTNECNLFKDNLAVHLKIVLISELFSWNSIKYLALADWVEYSNSLCSFFSRQINPKLFIATTLKTYPPTSLSLLHIEKNGYTFPATLSEGLTILKS